VAKRVRGPRSTHRPGGQGPSRVSREERATPSGRSAVQAPEPAVGTASVPARPPDTVSPEVPAPPAPRPRTAPRTEAAASARVSRTRSRARADSLASRASAELVYVTDDLRRIAVVSLVMLVVFGVIWLLLAVIDPLSVY
jgi:hypothetical protein